MAVNRSPTDHADHDELRIAAYAAGDLAGSELRTATELVATCPACARLADDLTIIQAATRRLPAPDRRRDFRLTEADAERLAHRGWRGFLGALAGPRFAFTQPLAAGLATLGLVGILLTALPAGLGGGFGASTESTTVGGAPESSGDRVASPPEALPSGETGAGAAGAANPAPSLTVPAPVASEDAAALEQASPLPAQVPGASAEPPAAPAGSGAVAVPPDAGQPTEPTAQQKSLAFDSTRDGTADAGPSPLLLASALLLIGGLGLLALRFGARRIVAR